MSLVAALDGLRTAIQTLEGTDGLRRVYTDPPASLNEFPCAFVVAASGEMSDTGAGALSLHTMAVEIYQAPNITAEAVDGAKVWPDRVLDALRTDPTLGGSVAHVRWPVTYQALGLQYNNTIHYGMRFNITAKVIEQ
jgi:hypothetical protein